MLVSKQISGLCLLFSFKTVRCHCGARQNTEMDLCGMVYRCSNRLRANDTVYKPYRQNWTGIWKEIIRAIHSVYSHGGHSPFIMLWVYRSWISCITVAPSLKLNIYDCAPIFHVLPGVLFLITSGKTESFRELVRNADKLFASLRNKNWCNWMSRSAGGTVLGKGSQNEIFDGVDVQKSLKVESMHHFLWLAIPRNTQRMTILWYTLKKNDLHCCEAVTKAMPKMPKREAVWLDTTSCVKPIFLYFEVS